MNVLYKLLGTLVNKEKVEWNEEISLQVDIAVAHDGSMPKIINLAKKLKSDEIVYGNKLYVTIDHYLPAPNIKAREEFKNIKEFCLNNRVNLYSNGEGVIHQVIAEEFNYSLGNKVVVGVDGHMCTSAALGALPFSITPEEMISVLLSGKYTIKVPRVVKVNFHGEFKRNNQDFIEISGKDISLFILGRLKSENIKGNGIVLSGKVLEELSSSQKMTVANMLGEIGARTVYFICKDINDHEEYYKEYNLKIDDIDTSIALPGAADNVVQLSKFKEEKVTQVYIGGCTNGRLDDMKVVSEILEGKEVHQDVTLIVCPASRKIANDMDKLGYSEKIRNSGGIIINPGCGACSGIHEGVLSGEDIIVTTTVRNSSGRMGDVNAQIYLASPIVAAKTAITGSLSS